MSESENMLNRGLAAGYAGSTNIDRIRRGPFSGKSSQLIDEGGAYRDEWFGGRAGGGQELSDTPEGGATRVYAGETLPDEDLEVLGLHKREVLSALTKFIAESEGKTRLRDDYSSVDGDWAYSYTTDVPVDEFPNTTRGVELISYREQPVFIHLHSIAPLD